MPSEGGLSLVAEMPCSTLIAAESATALSEDIIGKNPDLRHLMLPSFVDCINNGMTVYSPFSWQNVGED